MTKVVSILALAAILNGCASSPLVDEDLRLTAANPDAIAIRIGRQQHLFKACQKSYSSPRLEGRLVLRFKVRANGTTAQPHIYENIGQSAALDRCLTEAVLRLAFDPMPAGVMAQVEYPIEFKPLPVSSTRRPAVAHSIDTH